MVLLDAVVHLILVQFLNCLVLGICAVVADPRVRLVWVRVLSVWDWAVLALRCFWTASRSYEQSSCLRDLNLRSACVGHEL